VWQFGGFSAHRQPVTVDLSRGRELDVADEAPDLRRSHRKGSKLSLVKPMLGGGTPGTFMMSDLIQDIKIEDEEVAEASAHAAAHEPDVESINDTPTNLSVRDRMSEERSESRRSLKVAKRKKFEWQDEPTVDLIEYIRAHKSIWDVTDVMYRNVRLNKNLFLDLVQLLCTKYPDHGYTYEIVRRKWDSLKGYFSRQAQKNAEKDKPNGSTVENSDQDAADAVHWAYYDRLKFLSNSIKTDDDDERDDDDQTANPSATTSELSNGGHKSYHPVSKRRRTEQTPANPTEEELPTTVPTLEPSTFTATSNTNAEDQVPGKDPDEYGIGKYVGKILQGLDEDLVDELVSQVVRDCLEVRHKQRLRHIEYYHKHNSQGQ